MLIWSLAHSSPWGTCCADSRFVACVSYGSSYLHVIVGHLCAPHASPPCSHNRVGLIGAVAIIRAIPAPQLQVPSAPMLGTRTPTSAGSGFGAPSLPPPPLPPTPPPPQQQRARPHRGLWLRMEWNQVPFAGILAVLQEERDARGLVSDVPDQATLLSKCAQLCCAILRDWGGVLADWSDDESHSRPGLQRRICRSKMTYTSCHVCLPWLQGQRQAS